MRRALFGLCVAGFAAFAVSCGDPPPQQSVRVRVTGIRNAVGTLPFDATSFTVEVAVPGFNVGDAGADGGIAALRAMFWDHSDPFEFVVQLPVGSYGPPSVQVRTLYDCVGDGRTYREVVLGEGVAAGTAFDVRQGPVVVAPVVAVTPLGTSTFCH